VLETLKINRCHGHERITLVATRIMARHAYPPHEGNSPLVFEALAAMLWIFNPGI
jgi:hypothetical protein